MAFIKRTNKKFDYQPRYYKSDKDGSPYKMEGRFDSYRSTLSSAGGLKKRFTTAWDELQESKKGGYNKTIILISAILILLFLWLIDFDLSIFAL
ncbi:riboflavin synthase subunit beta [Dokdonia sinensis]|uniref:Riboflavin synthase subunit beta n=1 Tax=Dokdonia sinensis TaxID=2479847 RepID=A0A3M0GH48_9FLAO|nr:riboflavin synthase subunit beta [Dokdonia sinensis]RMB63990.1 riboflavin synthase subunit beta [Dokdonia sinensis]